VARHAVVGSNPTWGAKSKLLKLLKLLSLGESRRGRGCHFFCHYFAFFFQISGELLSGKLDIPFVRNVITVEDTAALVAANPHGLFLGNSCSDHVTDGSPAQIVNE
jgi:hypothetical protein